MDNQLETPVPPQMPPTPTPSAETEDEQAQIRRDAGLLLQFLQASPTARPYVDRIIREHLRDGVDLETWGHILNGLTLYAGEDVATFILVILLRSDDAEFLDLVEKHVGGEAWSYMRSLMALYSDALGEAYAVFGENPQGWKTVNRRVNYDHLTETWHAAFEIIRFDGERIQLDETPTSAIVLCQAILDALNAVPAELAPQAADRRAVEDLIGLVHAFVERFAPDFLEEDEEN
jgi:hypothetical protein